MFTQNLREAFRSVGIFGRLWSKLYNITRFPIVPIYGGFPVKLKTHIGKPIPYSDNLTPEQLQLKVSYCFIYIYRIVALTGNIWQDQGLIPSLSNYLM